MAPGSTVSNPTIALRVLQVVALLLPLAGIFLQVFLRGTETAGIETPADSLTAIALLVAFLSAAAVWATVELLLTGVSLPIMLALLGLVAAIGLLAVVTLQYVEVLDTDEPTAAVRDVGPPKAYRTRQECYYERFARGG